MTRALLVIICLALVALALWGMRRGWRARAARQADLAAPPTVPTCLGPAELRATGLYVGTTGAGSWQDRVVHADLGLRADAVLTLHPEGVLVERQGASAIFLPAADLVGARLAPGLAGKVVGAGGLLVVRWRLATSGAGSAAELDTGFQADDKSAYPGWVRAIEERVNAVSGTGTGATG